MKRKFLQNTSELCQNCAYLCKVSHLREIGIFGPLSRNIIWELQHMVVLATTKMVMQKLTSFLRLSFTLLIRQFNLACNLRNNNSTNLDGCVLGALISVIFFCKVSNPAINFYKLNLSRPACLLSVVMRDVKLLTAQGYLLKSLHLPLKLANLLICCFIRFKT